MSSLLSATELADLRTEWAAELTQRCEIQRPAKDGGGVSTGGHTVVASDVACRIDMVGGVVNVFNTTTRQTMTAYQPYATTLLVAYDQDVRVGDRAVVADGGGTYEVTQTHAESADRIGQTVDVSKVQAL